MYHQVNADPAAAGDATYQKVIDNLPKGVGKDAATKLDWNLDLNTLLPAEKVRSGGAPTAGAPRPGAACARGRRQLPPSSALSRLV